MAIELNKNVCQVNEVSIAQIVHLKEKGLKINLFIGRAPSRNEILLPARTSNEVWVSLDIQDVSEDAVQKNVYKSIHLLERFV